VSLIDARPALDAYFVARVGRARALGKRIVADAIEAASRKATLPIAKSEAATRRVHDASKQ
jgi:hypothetical protein